ncbi:hypothetical protein MtrunA17_Chr2g0330181 [Medicago truncatula]|uniref:Uncharacterized protein n=1 Tax=Medicago truncatula TaxID=3880 RepID=A0A396JIW7_MEDTR|nr:hypothetical protein MtrunA17_Chr2g0330181 [Medicago truncatula]
MQLPIPAMVRISLSESGLRPKKSLVNALFPPAATSSSLVVVFGISLSPS